MRSFSEISTDLSSPVAYIDVSLANMASIRFLALVVTYCLGCTVAKPTSHPQLAGLTSRSGRGTIHLPATDCLRKVCPTSLDNETKLCNWREVTKSAEYEQADDPSFFGKVLPTAAKADTQGWHHSANATACPDLVYQGSVGEHGGLRVGCVCSLHGLNSEHLLCSYDFKTKDKYAYPVQVNLNMLACSGLLNATTELFINTTSRIRRTPSAGANGTTTNGTEHPEKFENINKFVTPLGFGLGFGLGTPILILLLAFLAYKCCALEKVYCHQQQRRSLPSAQSNSSYEGSRESSAHSPVTPGNFLKTGDCFANPAVPAGDVSLFQHPVIYAQGENIIDPLQNLHSKGMDTVSAANLLTAKEYISENVELRNIPEALLTKGILTRSDYEEVVARKQERGRGRAMETLIDILSRTEHHNDITCFIELLDMPKEKKQALVHCQFKLVEDRHVSQDTNSLSQLEAQSHVCQTSV